MGEWFRPRNSGKLSGRNGKGRCWWKRPEAIAFLLAAGLSMGTGGPRGTVWAQEPATTQGTTGTQRTDPPGWPEKKRFFLRPTLDLPVSEVRTSLVPVEDSIQIGSASCRERLGQKV